VTSAGIQYTATRPRLCEGSDPRCREEIWMSWAAYKAAQGEGRVVCSACVPNRATVIRYLNAGSAAVIAL
jgi:hypothetical protein